MTAARATAALVAYVGVIVAANWTTNRYGFWPVLPGLTATAGTVFAGLALLLRDVVQDTAGRRWVLAGIAVGGAVSAAFNPALAIASAVAFTVSELADMAVYTPLRRRGWARAVLASNTVGAVLDTVLFLWLAGFPIWANMPGQIAGKLLWATLLPIVAVTAWRRWAR